MNKLAFCPLTTLGECIGNFNLVPSLVPSDIKKIAPMSVKKTGSMFGFLSQFEQTKRASKLIIGGKFSFVLSLKPRKLCFARIRLLFCAIFGIIKPEKTFSNFFLFV